MRVPVPWLHDFTDCQKRSDQELAVILTMAGLEVDSTESTAGMSVFELGVTPNRPDCLSMYGVAREIAAVCKGKLSLPRYKVPEGSDVITSHVRIAIQDAQGCPRYAARRIDGVRVGESPQDVQQRLEAAGIRPINNIVDATNYVMLELGQPLHAFDADHIRGQSLTIQSASEGQSFTTLDGVARSLCADDLMICDGEGPVAIAGVMGGENSEVRAETTCVILESAYFSPTRVRKTSKRLGLSTESSRRFERGVDPNRVLTALHRVTELVCAWAGGEPSVDWYDLYDTPIEPIVVPFELSQLERLLGVAIPAEEARGILKRLEFEVQGDGDVWNIVVPTDRPDITRPADIVEEIARIYGYDRIPEVMPEAQLVSPSLPERDQCTAMLRAKLQGAGFSEGLHLAFEPAADGAIYSWPEAVPLMLANPLGQEETWLKTTLVGGLVKSTSQNIRNGNTDIRLFELRPSYRSEDGECQESMRLGMVLSGLRNPVSWTQAQDMIDFFDARGVLEQVCDWVGVSGLQWKRENLPGYIHPGYGAWLHDGDGGVIGYVGLLHPRAAKYSDVEQEVFVIELFFDRLLGHRARHYGANQHRGIARYPGVKRDIAFVVASSVSAQQVTQAIRELQEPLITDVTLFDVYEGEHVAAGCKSLAYAIAYQDASRTLTDEDVQAVHDRVVAHLKQQVGAEIRSS